MSIIPMDMEHMQLTMQNDAQQMRTFLSWLQERNVTYQHQMTTDNMTAAGMDQACQDSCMSFIADIARLTAYVTGTPQTIAGDIRIDLTQVLGVV